MHKIFVKQTDLRRGFTLVEILVVIVIITILAAAMMGIGKGIMEKTKRNTTETTLQVLNSALQEYYDQFKGYPTCGPGQLYQALDALPSCREILERLPDNATGADQRLLDGWGTPLDYLNPNDGNFPSVSSAGSDGDFNTADDIFSGDL
ncbi:MAG: type II secretion system protein GspG [Phycisphaerae bacterium]|nr:type II secretion system protein GspG [Phycisphaerae bacterium]